MSLEDTLRRARAGDVKAQKDLGDCYYYGTSGCTQNFTQAAQWYEKAAKQGDGYGYGMYSLGYCYENGKGVTKNLSTALLWYREGANRGNSAAMYCIGQFYENGLVVNKNYDMASDWYVKARDAGNARACGKIGDILYYGKMDCNIDYKLAAEHYNLGADRGNAYCMYSLGYCYQYGKGIVKDTQQAVYWYRKAAEKGNSSAKEALIKLGY